MRFLRIIWENKKRYKKYFFIILACSLIFLFKGQLSRYRTLMSVKEISKNKIYTMNYYGDYRFEKYLKTGSKNYKGLEDFFNKNLLRSIVLKEVESNSLSCSAFSAINEQGQPILGRNLDLAGHHPILILLTDPPKGYASISLVELNILGYNNDTNYGVLKSPYKITSRMELMCTPYVPRDGMNEYGLAVATLDVPKEEIKNDMSRITLGRWQVLRLMLDYARNVDEAVALVKKYNSFDGAVHFFVCDASGDSAILEYDSGEIKVIRKEVPWQVVTNYKISSKDTRGGGRERFETASKILGSSDGIISEKDAMVLLDAVSQPSTVWSVVYNLKKGTVLLATDKNYENLIEFKLKMKF